jgi:hypothetical protein
MQIVTEQEASTGSFPDGSIRLASLVDLDALDATHRVYQVGHLLMVLGLLAFMLVVYFVAIVRAIIESDWSVPVVLGISALAAVWAIRRTWRELLRVRAIEPVSW